MAFVIPLIHHILVDKQSAADAGRPVVAAADDDAESDDESETQSAAMPSPLYALILTPTRELAMQTRDHIHQLTSYANITVCLLACLCLSLCLPFRLSAYLIFC